VLPTSQLILRNRAALGGESLLLVNPPADSLSRELAANGASVSASCQDRGEFRFLAAAGVDTAFGLLPSNLAAADTVVLVLPREKQRLQFLLHAISAGMTDQARLWLVGENAAGIKSAGRHLDAFFAAVNKLDAARHCGLFEARLPRRETPFEPNDYAEEWSFEQAGRSLRIISLPGVFAHGRLDAGSRMLLDNLPRLDLAGRVLDFACGSGVIGLAALAENPQLDLTMSDSSAAALESARRSLDANGLQARLVASDGLAEVQGSFDWILSNPPFHRGVRNELDIAARFFRETGTFLAQNGKIVIVCNRHLPYPGWLEQYFHQVQQLDGDNEYRVILARDPRD
jgi:16S rRNA (guanine1207-N2)-methyltransferase